MLMRTSWAAYQVAGPLDPVLASLANFSSPSHLKAQIELLFQLFDVDDSGAVSHDELRMGLGKLGYYPCIVMSSEDWETFTFHGQLLDDDDCLNEEAFDIAMRFQLSLFAQRLVANKMQQAIKVDSEHSAIFFALKMSMMQVFQNGWDTQILQADNTCRPARQTLPLYAEELQFPGTGSLQGNADGEHNRVGTEQDLRSLLAVIHTEIRQQHARIEEQMGTHRDTLKELLEEVKTTQAGVRSLANQVNEMSTNGRVLSDSIPAVSVASLSLPPRFPSDRSGAERARPPRGFETFELAGSPRRGQQATNVRGGVERSRWQSKNNDMTLEGTLTPPTECEQDSLRSDASLSLASKLHKMLR